MIDLFLSAKGRIPRQPFVVAILAVSLFVFLGNTGLRMMGNTMPAFYIALFFPFVVMYAYYCVFAKRLRDIGRSPGWFFGMIAIELLVVIGVMLSFGGAEYFAEFSEFERKEAIDPDITQAIIDTYQSRLAENMPLIRTLMLTIPLAFTAWLAFAPSVVDREAPATRR